MITYNTIAPYETLRVGNVLPLEHSKGYQLEGMQTQPRGLIQNGIQEQLGNLGYTGEEVLKKIGSSQSKRWHVSHVFRLITKNDQPRSPHFS